MKNRLIGISDKEARELIKDTSGITFFETGAIRDSIEGKEMYTETISWTAFRRYAVYMTGKREKYGSGNFKKGITAESYENSLMRHIAKYMINKLEDGSLEKGEDHLSAIIFNTLGLMHEEERTKTASNKIR